MATFIFSNNNESLYGRQPSCLNWITILPLGLWDTECAILWWSRQWSTSRTIFPCLSASDLAQVLNVSPLVIILFSVKLNVLNDWVFSWSYLTCCIFWPDIPLGVAPCPQTYEGLLIRPNVRAGIIGPWQVESITTTAVISWSVLRALVLQASVSGCWAFSAFEKIPRLIYRRHISACHLSHIREGLGLFPCRFTRWNNTGVLQILGGVGDNEQMTLLLYTVTTTSWNLMHIWCRYDISKLFNAFWVFGCLNFM